MSEASTLTPVSQMEVPSQKKSERGKRGNPNFEKGKAPAIVYRGIMMLSPFHGDQPIPRKDYIRYLFDKGCEVTTFQEQELPAVVAGNRSSVLKHVQAMGFAELTYQTVFQATKEDNPDKEPTERAGKIFITHPETGAQIGRTEYVQELLRGKKDQGLPGLSRRAVKNHLEALGHPLNYGTIYQISNKLRDREGIDITKDPKAISSGGGKSRGKKKPLTEEEVVAATQHRIDNSPAFGPEEEIDDDDDALLP